MDKDFAAEDKLARAYFYTAIFVALAIVAIFGILQITTRTPGLPQLESPELYYKGLTLHGILGLVTWPSLFILGFSLFVLTRELKAKYYNITFGWLHYFIGLAGSIIILFAVLFGKSAVLFTFYPPLSADLLFYVGAALFVVSIYLFALGFFLSVKRAVEERNLRWHAIPSGTVGVMVTLILFTIPGILLVLEVVVILALKLGLTTRIDPLFARNLFWFFGHPVVYVALVPVIAAWYAIMPKILKVDVYSHKLTRIVFASILIFGVPVGIHHQVVDPGLGLGIKYLSAHFFTYIVLLPSLFHAFNITATMEKAGRKNGGNGYLGWIRSLPWRNPVFLGMALAMIGFAWGGITGAVNAGFESNMIVHNTMWVPAHFHMTIATAVTLSFMAMAYLFIPALTGNALVSRRWARIQLWLWFIGVYIFSFALSWAGIMGVPRRTFDVTYFGNFDPGISMQIGWIGGALMFVSIVLFLALMALTIFNKRKLSSVESLYA